MLWNNVLRYSAAVGLICGSLLVSGRSAEGGESALRSMRYTSRPLVEAQTWQQQVRASLWPLLKLEDLLAERATIALNPTVLSSVQKDGWQLQQWEINSTPARRIKVLVGRPTQSAAPRPAVVCVHGHGGNQHSVYEPKSLYRGFASALAQRGYVTIAADVGQHQVYEDGRTLMGERLWDLMRCVDYLQSLPEVDKSRIGCAGLSLGGEMTMWLGAMDTRVAATLSSGFLTNMDQMEQNHCMCWKFDGLRELVDFADIYALTAPRPLLCQNGLQEPPSQFPVPLAVDALREIGLIYTDYGRPQNAALQAHLEGHIINLPGLLAFFDQALHAAAKPAVE
jgi:hypothetical protein